MIARLWHGKVPSEKTGDYHAFLNETGLKDYAAIQGNKGVFLLKKEEKDIAHFYTLTFWDNLDAIREFAGDDYEKARYYPEDKDFLLEFEPFVTHFDVLEKPAGF
ncbi:MAG: antibiotic biosynthesis monooxygenase [Chitinophagaceae bacterium]